MKILVVEDQPRTACYLRTGLIENGFVTDEHLYRRSGEDARAEGARAKSYRVREVLRHVVCGRTRTGVRHPGRPCQTLCVRASPRPTRQFAMMIQNLLAFTAAAILEILGCFTFWLWLRRGASPAIAAFGIVSLIGFAVALTRVDAAFAGRAYAAYGGIYIAASLVWLWLIEGQQPTGSDLLGAGIAIIGALVIVGLAART